MEEAIPVHDKKWEEVHKSPNENGEHRSNGREADAKSDRSRDRKPDIVDDHREKSRSTSHSCHF